MSCLCIFGVESRNITSLSREHVTHALYICYMTMSCLCLSLIKFMLCYVMLCYKMTSIMQKYMYQEKAYLLDNLALWFELNGPPSRSNWTLLSLVGGPYQYFMKTLSHLWNPAPPPPLSESAHATDLFDRYLY